MRYLGEGLISASTAVLIGSVIAEKSGRLTEHQATFGLLGSSALAIAGTAAMLLPVLSDQDKR